MQVSEAAKRSRAWLLQVGMGLSEHANKYNQVIDRLVDKMVVISYASELPDEMIVRLRCLPHVFEHSWVA